MQRSQYIGQSAHHICRGTTLDKYVKEIILVRGLSLAGGTYDSSRQSRHVPCDTGPRAQRKTGRS